MRLTMPELKPAAERYVAMTLDLIAERGTSVGVNLREVSRRLGHAHTNVYNYFKTYDDLLEHALRRAILHYAKAMVAGLHDGLPAANCYRRFTRNTVEWSIRNPGYHRFISTDPLDPDTLPQDIIDNVMTLKAWIAELLGALSDHRIAGDALVDLRDIQLGYLDGEVTNLLNGRVLPGEDPAERVLRNLEKLFALLVTTADSSELSDQVWATERTSSYPVFEIVKLPLE